MNVPRLLWDLATRAGERIRLGPTEAFQLMLTQIEAGVLREELRLPDIFGLAYEQLKREAADTRVGDVTKLHLNPKLRSGFEGVQMSGTQFIATVPRLDVAGAAFGRATVPLGRYNSPQEAAWARREYFVKHGLSYGGLAEETQRIMKEMEGTPTTPEFARRLAINENAKRGVLFPDLSDEDRKWERMSPFDAEYDPGAAKAKAEKKRAQDEENRVRAEAYKVKRVKWREEQAALAAVRRAEAKAEEDRVINLRAAEKAALERIRIREGRGPMIVPPPSTGTDDD